MVVGAVWKMLTLRRSAMRQDFSWDHAARDYEQLYLDAYRRRRGHAFASLPLQVRAVYLLLLAAGYGVYELLWKTPLANSQPAFSSPTPNTVWM